LYTVFLQNIFKKDIVFFLSYKQIAITIKLIKTYYVHYLLCFDKNWIKPLINKSCMHFLKHSFFQKLLVVNYMNFINRNLNVT